MVNLSKEELAEIKQRQMKIWQEEQRKIKIKQAEERERRNLEIYGDGSNLNKALRGSFHLSKIGFKAVRKIVKSK